MTADGEAERTKGQERSAHDAALKAVRQAQGVGLRAAGHGGRLRRWTGCARCWRLSLRLRLWLPLPALPVRPASNRIHGRGIWDWWAARLVARYLVLI
jgi:hypothetical protein